MRYLRGQRGLLAAAGLGLLWLAFYAGWLAVDPGGAHGRLVFADTAYLVPIVAATLLAAYAWRRGPVGLRTFWALMMLSNALWLGAEALWSIRELGGSPVPFPWWTDAGYIASYAVIPFALFAGFRPTRRSVGSGSILDAAVVVGALALLWWWIVLRPLSIGGDLASLVGLAYPSFGLILIGMLAATRFLPARRGGLALRLVAAGIACSALADGLYTSGVVTHSYFSGEWIGLGWQAEAVLFSIAAFVSGRAIDSRPDWTRFRDPARMSVAATVLAALGVLLAVVAAAGIRGQLSAGALAAAGALGVLVGVRLWLALGAAPSTARFKDEQTGTYDASYFEDQLRRLHARARLFGDSFGVAVADVDDSSAARAPQAEPEIGTRLASAAREVDAVARLGPGRFAVLLPNVEQEEAMAMAERLRAFVAYAPIQVAGNGEQKGVTISIGVAAWTQQDEPARMLERAHDAVATAKRLGGNQVRGATVNLLFEAGELDAERFELLVALAKLVDSRESEDGEHSRAIASLASEIACEMGLSAEAAARAYVSGLLHDLGKIALPESMLRKPGPLDEREWDEMFRHPGRGAELVERIGAIRDAAPIIAAHHERWDGTGYPRGLAQERIPAEARIVAVADALVSMTSERPYRGAVSLTSALTEIWRQSGERYDPSVVSALLALARDGRLKIADAEADAAAAGVLELGTFGRSVGAPRDRS